MPKVSYKGPFNRAWVLLSGLLIGSRAPDFSLNQANLIADAVALRFWFTLVGAGGFSGSMPFYEDP